MKNILTIIALLMGATAFAQDLSILSCKEKENDVDARLFPKKDRNDKACALVKIVTTRDLSEFIFDGTVVASEQKDGEIWVYLRAGERLFTIRHKTLGVIADDYQFGEPLKESTVYIMTLKMPPKEEDKATLQVYVDDEMAAVNVYIDGQPEGYAPVTIDVFAKEKKVVEWVKTGYRREKKTITLEPGYNEVSAKLVRAYINGFQLAAEGMMAPTAQQGGGNFIMGYRFNAHLALGVGGGFHSYTEESRKGTVIPGFIDFRVNLLRTKFSPYFAIAGGVCFDRYTNTDTYINPAGAIEMNSEHQTLYAYYQAAAGLHLRCSDVFALYAGAGYNNMAAAVAVQAGLSVTFVK
jgi:hypothetical protein